MSLAPRRVWLRNSPALTLAGIGVLAGLMAGCQTLFGWDIHAPGLLSEDFAHSIPAVPERVALYLEPDLIRFTSTDRGSKTADPQTYHVGEALAPMLIEAFQQGFDEFLYFEVPPDARLMQRYGVPYLVTVRIKEFSNKVTWKGQAVRLLTEALLLDEHLTVIHRFESRGASDADRVFSKKGGPEVNLNLAIENNVRGLVQFIQDKILEK